MCQNKQTKNLFLFFNTAKITYAKMVTMFQRYYSDENKEPPRTA